MGAPAETEPKPDENAVPKPVKKEPTGIMASGVKYLADFPDIAVGERR